MFDWYRQEGSPSPLGVNWIADEQAFNFALYSKHASEVRLLLYAEEDVVRPILEYPFNPLINKSGRVWHCRIPAAAMKGSRYYGYHISGPNEPGAGHRFDDQKVLVDPYAHSLYFPPQFSRQIARLPGSNAGRGPLGVLPAWNEEAVVARPNSRCPSHASDLVIYELHVRSFTARPNSGICEGVRGTFRGVIEKIPYLKELGITAVELMPITQQDPQEGCIWGYMPLGYFAVNSAYSCSALPEDAVHEFRSMVDALHAAHIEVILDVVFSHTAEGGDTGPIYSFKGIDNSTYYLLESDWMHYRDDTMTGNTLNCSNRYVRKMIVDSLHYWVREFGIDGFRFDLASIFTRKEDGTIDLDDPPVIDAVSASINLSNVRLIAEAWDPVSYQLGRTYPGISWLQWNGKYRDDIRSFLRGDPGTVGSLMTRMYGSCDLFPDDVMNAYHAYQSVNFITCHDGFCLYDLVAYGQKRNVANGEDNRDGSDYNLSWNCGWEGDDGVPESVMTLRKRQAKNACCLLFLSNGTPMFRSGDEFLNTQQGNNNPYNQDNEISWIDWDLLVKNREIFRFFQCMIAFRKAHPSICRSRFWREDVRWFGVGNAPDLSFDSHSLAFCLHGASQGDADLYVMINGFHEDLNFAIQEGAQTEWTRIVDTSYSSPEDFCEADRAVRLETLVYSVKARSIVVLMRT